VICTNVWAVLDPAVPELLPLLEYRRFDFVPGGPTGYERQQKPQHMHTTDLKGGLSFPVGLLPRMTVELQRLGYEVVVTKDLSTQDESQEPEPDWPETTTDEPEERRLVEAVVGHRRGQVEVRDFHDMIAKAALICRLFPKAHVVLGVHTRKKARKIERALQSTLQRPVEVVAATQTPPKSRVAVSTFVCLDTCTQGRQPILLLPDAHEATGDSAAGKVVAVDAPRAYAFAGARRRMGRGTRLRLEAMAGPPIFKAGRPRAAVRVCFARSPKTGGSEATGLERKRHTVWHNTDRNKALASIVAAVEQGNQAKLAKRGIVIDSSGLPDGDMMSATQAVLVESTEHGQELLPLLPGWVLLDNVWPDTDDGKPMPAPRPLDKVIVTEARAGRTRIGVDILVRATGGSSRFQVRDFPPLDAPVFPRQAYLIDLEDAFDDEAVRETSRRRHDYEGRGW
jgi:hypothetical protein